MLIDLLKEKDTSFIGIIGEDIAWKYLRDQRIVPINKFLFGDEFLRFLRDRLKGRLKEKQIQYLESLAREGSRWSFDFIALKGYEKSEPYLIEVKTSRPGKSKHSLKGNWSRRSRKGWTKKDIEEAKSLHFKLLLVNVQFLDNWKFEVTSREL
ncbi:MAG: hypothetical protein KAW90_06255 [Dehalococcoidales bacterium]|nr:hypothetical protein [Dehalococcoidales bacterium]